MTSKKREDRNTRWPLPGQLLSVATLLLLVALSPRAESRPKLRVVATLTTYGSIAKAIAGDRAEVLSLAKGYEDPHFVRPKPSLARNLERADLLLSTGLDLELWLPSLVDKANNPAVRSGQRGYVSVSQGISLIEKPEIMSRSEGGVHIYGNPHIYTGPLNGKIIARNIMIGLRRLDPDGAAHYEASYQQFVKELDRRLFGETLVKLLGSTLLTKLALTGKLIPFLEGQRYKGKKLTEQLGGWLKQALPLRGRKIVAYHKNWGYFSQTFGIEIVEYVEPKPGIPPSPGHVARVIRTMQEKKIKLLLAASYYDTAKVKSIATRVGAIPVIVGLAVGGEPKITDFFAQFDVWIGRLVEAAKQADQS
jgi:ABC-type Zn uptake system ZnuABC Zn-binding protein ZnuA